MICPKCGEVNSSNFLFCGMCGTILEPARRAAAPAPAAPARAAESHPAASPAVMPPPAASPSPSIAVPPSVAANEPTPPISGPSILGLDQSNVDVLRERAFSGLASYAQPEPRSARKEVLLTIVLLAALGGAGWWTYKNYIGVTGIPKPAAEVTAPAAEEATVPPKIPAPKPDETSTEKSAAPTEPAASENPPEKASVPPETKPADATPESAEAKTTAGHEPQGPPKPVTPAPTQARHEVSADRVPAPKPVVADSGEASYRRGEKYLYGRGGAADCANAIKYLKMASDKDHAKARSTMGTMYATGHCVPRDLPSSYRWFALALRADPNNTLVEKNLRAVWNQMTPPERQLATKTQ